MVMNATVQEVRDGSLLVIDHANRQQVVVNTRCACRFREGDRIRILFNGVMTMSLPPQINAIRINRLPRCGC